MTDELCAQEGCGAPKAWHTTKSTIVELAAWGADDGRHDMPFVDSADGACLGDGCECDYFLAPEPPEPERTAYVVEVVPPSAGDGDRLVPLSSMIPLPDYLASHFQEATP